MTQDSGNISTDLYLVRHGQTELNRKRIVQGRGVNPSLNELGRDQAMLLASRAAQWELDAIYCSTLRRAGETAHIVAAACPGVPVFALEDLEEMSWGVYEGESPSPAMKEAFTFMVNEWKSGNYAYKVDEGESVLEVQDRARRAMAAILANHAGNRVLVVSHGRYLRIMIAGLLEEYGLGRMEELKHTNTSVNHLVHDGKHFEARMLNDTQHLDVLEQTR